MDHHSPAVRNKRAKEDIGVSFPPPPPLRDPFFFRAFPPFRSRRLWTRLWRKRGRRRKLLRPRRLPRALWTRKLLENQVRLQTLAARASVLVPNGWTRRGWLENWVRVSADCCMQFGRGVSSTKGLDSPKLWEDVIRLYCRRLQYVNCFWRKYAATGGRIIGQS